MMLMQLYEQLDLLIKHKRTLRKPPPTVTDTTISQLEDKREAIKSSNILTTSTL